MQHMSQRFQYHFGVVLLAFLAATSAWPTNSGVVLYAEELKSDESVTFFPTCGYLDEHERAWMLPIHGWLFEPDDGSRSRRFALALLRRALRVEPTPEEEPVFLKRGWPFVVDSVEDRELTVELDTKFVLVEPSADNGHAFGIARLEASRAKLIAADGWLRYRADTEGGDFREVTGRVQLVPPRGVSVISDVDDTIKISQVTDRRQLLENTFLRPMDPVPGMAALYRRWAADGAAFHYVTASPWQLYAALEEFRAAWKYPAGSFHMQYFRWKDRTVFNLFTDPDKLKQSAIETLLKQYPRRRFIFVGDSGERDPELYASFARKYPEQTIGIYIRNVSRETADNERFRRVFAGLEEITWRLFDDPIELNEVLLPEAGD